MLVRYIDAAIEFVRKHLDWMTRDEVAEFHRLAEEVYLAACRAGIADSIPKIPDLRPAIESNDPPLPPVQFESKLNLPGDWDIEPIRADDDPLPVAYQMNPNGTWFPIPNKWAQSGESSGQKEPVFLVCGSARWFHDMAVLRRRAEDVAPAGVPKEESGPKKMLTTWREITEALGENHTQRGKIKRLNESLNGPIPKVAQGSQPRVEKEKLIDWWNRLAIQQMELANQSDGEMKSAAAQYNYGRDGAAAPEIGGHVKKRRGDKKR